MRTDIRFNLVCSKCGNELEADNKKSKLEYRSASKATTKMAIKPCSHCYRAAREPARLIAVAIKSIEAEGA